MATKSVVVRGGSRPVIIRQKVRRRRSQFTLPLAVVAGFAPVTYYSIKALATQGVEAAVGTVVYEMTGYSMQYHQWNAGAMIKGWAPIILGMAAHKIANVLGINRAMARAKIPIIRI